MNILQFGTAIALVGLSIALVFTVYRLAKGANLGDRVEALDMLAVIAVLIMGVLAVRTKNPVLMEGAVVIALLAFMSTVAFARYMERR